MATTARIAAPPRIDQIDLTAYPYRGRSHSLNDILASASWTELAGAAAVEATFTFGSTGAKGLGGIVAPGTWLIMRVWDAARGKWFRTPFHFYVWDRALTDEKQNTTTVTAYDALSFLSRTGKRTWVFKKGGKHAAGWTASDIAKGVLQDFDIPYSVTPTEYKIPFLRVNGSAMDIILAAYSEERANTGRRYRFQALGRTLAINLLRPQQRTWYFSEGNNLLSASWKESLDGVATVVRAVSLGDNNIPKNSARAESVRGLRKYGRLVENIEYDQTNASSGKQLKELATKRLAKVSSPKKTIRIEGQGVPSLRATDGVLVVDSGTGIKTLLFADSVTHDITPGSHRTVVELNRSAKVPVRKPTEGELTEELTQETPAERDGFVTMGPNGMPYLDGKPLFPELGPQEVAPIGAVGGAVQPSTGPIGGLGTAPMGAKGIALTRAINNFIHSDTPLAGKGEMFVRIGNQHGVNPAFLAVLAAKESTFGRNAGRGAFNVYNWGHYDFSSYEEATQTVARGLVRPDGYYLGKGFRTLAQIIPVYAPYHENDTALYIRQATDWMRRLGQNPAASVFAAPGSWA